ncbi:MAG: hypothetical protein HETSPECPRED_003468 [Heterodermia speciosa]|uniref:Acyl-CoA thioesterase-like C-terminal domain-containing protein n=1 Tax=Heterodermia speciosa TaxID=116794 RepID=A0A8H3EHS1_9LECA|nr:MAG: hypothetical protein HETSPECPRED_003468 [Heterodermia speciosa]
MNMDHERGLSLATDFRLDPEPVPAVVERLANGTEPGWADWIYPRHPNSPFKAFTHVRYFFPVQGVAHPSISDAWLTPLCKDDTFTTETLGSVVDLWHRMVENYRPDAEWGTRNVPKRALHIFQQHSVATTDEGVPKTPYAYPTLSMALEIKKLLPPEGAKWLFVRARAKQIKNGRFDAEVIILDQRMKIVAVSHQINSIVELKPDDKISQIRGKSRL